MNTNQLVRGVLRCLLAAALGCLGLALPPRAGAQPPNYGHDFVTVDAPNNRRPNQQEAPGFYPPLVGPKFVPPGRVSHRYRITRTEVSVRQWYDFVVAYAPYWAGSPNDSAFTSDYISYRQGSYRISPGAENFSANMSWYNAARYANWHHNGRVTERSAFEDGAYDTSSFRIGPNGWPMDQLTHHPEAKFWIPTWDEWVKAGFYDPDRYGLEQKGYWLYPNQSNAPPLSGYPSQGGETNAGIPGIFSGQFDVGSYPQVQSPWGLLDVSGGVREWLETSDDPSYGRTRYQLGSNAGAPHSSLSDRIDWFASTSPRTSGAGLRLVSAVPAPSATLTTLVVAACLSVARPRRRTPC